MDTTNPMHDGTTTTSSGESSDVPLTGPPLQVSDLPLTSGRKTSLGQKISKGAKELSSALTNSAKGFSSALTNSAKGFSTTLTKGAMGLYDTLKTDVNNSSNVIVMKKLNMLTIVICLWFILYWKGCYGIQNVGGLQNTMYWFLFFALRYARTSRAAASSSARRTCVFGVAGCRPFGRSYLEGKV